MIDRAKSASQQPLTSLDEWEDDLKRRYPEPAADNKPFCATDPDKKKEEFRDYRAEAAAFYGETGVVQLQAEAILPDAVAIPTIRSIHTGVAPVTTTGELPVLDPENPEEYFNEKYN